MSRAVPAVGLHLPHFGPLATPAHLRGVVALCERRGLASVWAGDHIALPTAVDSRYPYHAKGTPSFDAAGPYFDAFVLLSFAAARTERLRIGFSVVVVPYRHPLETAKLLASLDALSDGRVIAGVGAGWLAEEFAALGVDYASRGAITDEYLDVMRRAWEASPVAHEGVHVRFAPVGVAPLPRQRPGPPLWVGGHSDAAMRRALRVGGGWQAVADGPAALAALVDRLRAHAGGALPDGFVVSSRLHLPRFDPDPGRSQAFGPDEARELVAGYGRAGAAHVVIDLWDRDPGRYLARLEALADWLALPAATDEEDA